MRSVLIGLLFVFFPLWACGQTSIRWIAAGPLMEPFQDVMRQGLESTKQYMVQPETIQAADLKRTMEAIAGTDAKTPVILQCTLGLYEEILKDPEARKILSRLNLRLANPRLFSVPFYLLSLPEGGKPSGEPLQVAFITQPVAGRLPVEEADLLNALSEILGRPRNAIHILPERDAYTAAKNFYAGAYHLVGIYEDEPSTLLDEFEVNLTQELRAGEPRTLPLGDQQQQMYVVAPGRLAYVVFRGKDPLGSEKELTLVALVQNTSFPFPVILTNMPEDSQRVLEMAFSHACFLAFPDPTKFVTDQKTAFWVERMFLFNAFLIDPSNRLKGIAALSTLMLMKDWAGNDKKERALYEDRFRLFLRTLNLAEVNSNTVFQWLGVKVPQLDKRQLFTDDISRLYQEALLKIDKANGSRGDIRAQLLEEAKKDLIAAILHDDSPRAIKGSRGLWSAANYNPYYQLARVIFLLQLEGRSG